MDISSAIITASAVVTALATAGLMVFAMTQWQSLKRSVQESTKTRSAAVLLKIYDMMGELRPKWHKLYGFPQDHRRWTAKQLALADEVGTELQRVAYLCLKGLVEEEFVIDGYGKVFVNCWDLLAPYISDYRAESGEPRELRAGGYQRMHFEQFAAKCKQELRLP